MKAWKRQISCELGLFAIVACDGTVPVDRFPRPSVSLASIGPLARASDRSLTVHAVFLLKPVRVLAFALPTRNGRL